MSSNFSERITVNEALLTLMHPRWCFQGPEERPCNPEVSAARVEVRSNERKCLTVAIKPSTVSDMEQPVDHKFDICNLYRL